MSSRNAGSGTRSDRGVTGSIQAPRVAHAPEMSSTDSIQVTIPQDADISQEELLLRLRELIRSRAHTRQRAAGEPVGLGDTVVLDVLGFVRGRLLPFSVQNGVERELTPAALMPGLCEGLVGTPVGSRREVEGVLPATWPVESLRGERATFQVDVVAAREVTLPEGGSEAFLRTLGRGTTLEALMESIADEIAEERADAMWRLAQEQVLEELARHAETVQKAQVDEEIRQNWQATEARLLAARNLPPEQLRQSLDGWRNDATTRRETERRLRIASALKGVIAREGLRLTPEKLDRVLEEAGASLGLTLEEARRALNDPEQAEGIRQSALQVVAARHVMARARVRFEGIPGLFSAMGQQLG